MTEEIFYPVCARIPTPYGEFQLCIYEESATSKEHLALVMGDPEGKDDVLVRVHSECFTGDVLGSLRCDCGEQLHHAMAMIAEAGEGTIIYLRQEGRGIGLEEKLRAYNLQDDGYDTVDANLALGHQADERNYTCAVRILENLGIRSIALITNNPSKIEALNAMGMKISRRIPLTPTINPENLHYLSTKAKRMHHLLDTRSSENMPDASSD
jgi:GTP cyclohydrolase II